LALSKEREAGNGKAYPIYSKKSRMKESYKRGKDTDRKAHGLGGSFFVMEAEGAKRKMKGPPHRKKRTPAHPQKI